MNQYLYGPRQTYKNSEHQNNEGVFKLHRATMRELTVGNIPTNTQKGSNIKTMYVCDPKYYRV